MIIRSILFIIFFSFDTTSAVGVDLDLSLDKSNWIDPNDPLAHPHGSVHSATFSSDVKCDGACEQSVQELNELRRMYAALQNSRENTVDVLLKHVLRGILINLDVDLNLTISSGESVHRMAYVDFSLEDIWAIHRYLSSQRSSEEISLREDVRYALDGSFTKIAPSYTDTLFEFVVQMVPYIVLLNVIVLPLAIWNVLRSICSPRQMVLLTLLSAFGLSCYFTYTRKYQEILAQRFERDHHGDGKCTPNGLLSEAYNVLLGYVRIKGKSECLQHYEDLLIEPIWLIDPLSVFAEVLSNFLFTPLSVVGVHFNKFFNDFFINTPFYLAIVKIAFLLCAMFYLTGYRIRTILGTIEPVYRPVEQPIHQQVPSALLQPSAPLPAYRQEAIGECRQTSKHIPISQNSKDQRRESKNELIIADLMYRLRKEVALVAGAKNILKILGEQKKQDSKSTKDAMETHTQAQEKIDLICLALRKYSAKLPVESPKRASVNKELDKLQSQTNSAKHERLPANTNNGLQDLLPILSISGRADSSPTSLAVSGKLEIRIIGCEISKLSALDLHHKHGESSSSNCQTSLCYSDDVFAKINIDSHEVTKTESKLMSSKCWDEHFCLELEKAKEIEIEVHYRDGRSLCAFAVLKLGDIIEKHNGGMVIDMEPQGAVFVEIMKKHLVKEPQDTLHINFEWEKLLNRELKPKFVPKIANPADVSNFGSEFTSEASDDFMDADDSSHFHHFDFSNI